MKEIKFRYVIKYNADQIKTFVLTLDDIQKRCGAWDEIDKFLDSVGLVNYQIIARDLFTGLKDNGGKEIYEGDIIAYSFYISDTEQEKGTGEAIFEKSAFYVDEWFLANIDQYGITGNIYENPELLK